MGRVYDSALRGRAQAGEALRSGEFMSYNLWSGRVVDHWQDAERRVVHRGSIAYCVMDISRGSIPGTVEWPDMLGPLPKIWRRVEYRPSARTTVIAPGLTAYPLRLWVYGRALGAWIYAFRHMTRRWWACRPPFGGNQPR